MDGSRRTEGSEKRTGKGGNGGSWLMCDGEGLLLLAWPAPIPTCRSTTISFLQERDGDGIFRGMGV